MKKVRGWKRRLRQLEKWEQEHSNYNDSFLKEYQYEYIKLFTLPYDIKIPNWYKREVVRVLLNIFDEWTTQARADHNRFFASVIINEVDIMESQVLISIGEEMDRYLTDRRPIEKLEIIPLWLQCKKTKLEWKPFMSTYVLLEDELEDYPEKERNEIIKKIVERKEVSNSDYECELLVNDGITWHLDNIVK